MHWWHILIIVSCIAFMLALLATIYFVSATLYFKSRRKKQTKNTYIIIDVEDKYNTMQYLLNSDKENTEFLEVGENLEEIYDKYYENLKEYEHFLGKTINNFDSKWELYNPKKLIKNYLENISFNSKILSSKIEWQKIVDTINDRKESFDKMNLIVDNNLTAFERFLNENQFRLVYTKDFLSETHEALVEEHKKIVNAGVNQKDSSKKLNKLNDETKKWDRLLKKILFYEYFASDAELGKCRMFLSDLENKLLFAQKQNIPKFKLDNAINDINELFTEIKESLDDSNFDEIDEKINQILNIYDRALDFFNRSSQQLIFIHGYAEQIVEKYKELTKFSKTLEKKINLLVNDLAYEDENYSLEIKVIADDMKKVKDIIENIKLMKAIEELNKNLISSSDEDIEQSETPAISLLMNNFFQLQEAIKSIHSISKRANALNYNVNFAIYNRSNIYCRFKHYYEIFDWIVALANKINFKISEDVQKNILKISTWTAKIIQEYEMNNNKINNSIYVDIENYLKSTTKFFQQFWKQIESYNMYNVLNYNFASYRLKNKELDLAYLEIKEAVKKNNYVMACLLLLTALKKIRKVS
ncbi:hypothetical protein ACA758_00765 [Mycoplasmopsis agassizii]|uniref:hypothetical protein n=1 Tax=Mycoplasmopsis agassizii TaxID=33922 RepID=UPI003527A62F